MSDSALGLNGFSASADLVLEQETSKSIAGLVEETYVQHLKGCVTKRRKKVLKVPLEKLLKTD